MKVGFVNDSGCLIVTIYCNSFIRTDSNLSGALVM